MEQDSEIFEVVVLAQEEIFSEALSVLKNGQIVAVPTDTGYSLVCDAYSATAIQHVYEIKKRHLSSPLAICVADVALVNVYAYTMHLPPGLLESLLPGAVTLLLPRRPDGRLSLTLNPKVTSIGIRIPKHKFLRDLSRALGQALVLTSANTSNQRRTTKVEEFEHMWPHCALILDAGKLSEQSAKSTIVDLTQEGIFRVVRSGSMLWKTKETLEAFGLQEASSSGVVRKGSYSIGLKQPFVNKYSYFLNKFFSNKVKYD